MCCCLSKTTLVRSVSSAVPHEGDQPRVQALDDRLQEAHEWLQSRTHSSGHSSAPISAHPIYAVYFKSSKSSSVHLSLCNPMLIMSQQHALAPQHGWAEARALVMAPVRSQQKGS